MVKQKSLSQIPVSQLRQAAQVWRNETTEQQALLTKIIPFGRALGLGENSTVNSLHDRVDDFINEIERLRTLNDELEAAAEAEAQRYIDYTNGG